MLNYVTTYQTYFIRFLFTSHAGRMTSDVILLLGFDSCRRYIRKVGRLRPSFFKVAKFSRLLVVLELSLSSWLKTWLVLALPIL